MTCSKREWWHSIHVGGSHANRIDQNFLTINFSGKTQNWLHLVDGFNDKLKELGDMESWSKSIEIDMKTISSSLEYIYKVNREAQMQVTLLYNN